MKCLWFATLALCSAPLAVAQTTIYKHVDESGHVTYSNKPMKGATVVDLEPLTTFPTPPVLAVTVKSPTQADRVEPAKPEAKQPVAIVTPLPAQTLASVEPQMQKRRDNDRRKILEEELLREEQSLAGVRGSLVQEQQNPTLIAAVRAAQQAADPTPTQLAEFRSNIDKASGRIRGLQATVAEHEKNIEALKKELGALKP